MKRMMLAGIALLLLSGCYPTSGYYYNSYGYFNDYERYYGRRHNYGHMQNYGFRLYRSRNLHKDVHIVSRNPIQHKGRKLFKKDNLRQGYVGHKEYNLQKSNRQRKNGEQLHRSKEHYKDRQRINKQRRTFEKNRNHEGRVLKKRNIKQNKDERLYSSKEHQKDNRRFDKNRGADKKDRGKTENRRQRFKKNDRSGRSS